MLTKEAILAKSLVREPIEVKEWGGTVYIRRMSGAEREACLESSRAAAEGGKSDGQAFQYKMLSTVLCNDKGEALFTEQEVREQLDAVMVDKLLGEAMRICGFDREKLEKN